MATLIPVDHDPFAPASPGGSGASTSVTNGAQPTFTPVDHDPFVTPETRATNPWVRKGDIAARGAIRYLGGIPNTAAALVQSGPGILQANADQVAAETGGNYGAGDVVGGPETVPKMWMPSEAVIDALGWHAPSDQTPGERAAEFAVPFLIPSPNTLSRVQEASGVFNKGAELLGGVTGGGIDAGLSYLGGQAGENWIGGPRGAFIGSLFGGGVRPTLQRGFGWGASRTEAAPDAPEIFDAMTNPAGPNAMPTFGQVSGPSGKQFEKAVEAVPILRSGVRAARGAAEQGITNAVATGIGEVGDRAPTTSPVSEATTASRIIDLSRATNTAKQEELSAQQQALEDAIGANRPTDVSPLVDTISSLANASPAPIQRTLQPRVNDLYGSINPNPPEEGPLTAPYEHLKILRGDLGQRTKSADPVPGRFLDQTYGAYTDAMRGAAEEAGQGSQFDQANLDYSTFKKVNQPWLERQGGGLEQGATQPSPTTISSRATAITGASPNYLDQIKTQLGLDPARSTLADVLSRLGDVKGQFTPSRWGSDYEAVNPVVKQFIAEHAPTVTPYLENAATGGRAFDIRPERPGMSNALGFLGGLGEFLSKYPRLAVGVAGGLETPSVVRAVAGRPDIPALLAQYAQRQGSAAGFRGSQ
jgi:hypothetical protein